MNNKAITLLPVLVLASMTAACDDFDFDMGNERVEAPFHYNFDVQPGARLQLETFNGSVEIRAWDQNKVDIAGVKYARSAALRDAIKVEANGTPQEVTVRVVRPSEHGGNIGAKFVVRVPRDIALDRITSSNGSIRVEETNGPVRLRTSNASMHLARLHGAVDAQTSNSGIELSELTGNAILHTSNGHIQADHVSGPVDANSSNGSIHLGFDQKPKSDIRATTSNSSIEITMPSASAVRVRANTSNSSITSDFEVSTQGTQSKTHLDGTVNGGGPLLDLSTSNGSIKLSKP